MLPKLVPEPVNHLEDTSFEFAERNFLPSNWWSKMQEFGHSETHIINYVTSIRARHFPDRAD